MSFTSTTLVPTQPFYANGTVIGVTGVLVGLLAIIVAILLWRFGPTAGILEYGIIISQAVISKSSRIPDLEVRWRSKEVQDPYMVAVLLKNRSSRDIRSSDFEDPLSFDLDVPILDFLPTVSGDEKLAAIEDKSQLILHPTLIKRGSEIVIFMLTDGRPKISCNRSLADIRVRLSKNEGELTIGRFLALQIGGMTFILLAGMILFLNAATLKLVFAPIFTIAGLTSQLAYFAIRIRTWRKKMKATQVKRPTIRDRTSRQR